MSQFDLFTRDKQMSESFQQYFQRRANKAIIMEVKAAQREPNSGFRVQTSSASQALAERMRTSANRFMAEKKAQAERKAAMKTAQGQCDQRMAGRRAAHIQRTGLVPCEQGH